MDEKILYTSLLKGAVVGNLRYADNLAMRVADLIEKTNASGTKIAELTPELIYYYGDMLEEEEEQALESAVAMEGNAALPGLLRELDVKYGGYFLEMLSGRRERVEMVYNDVAARCNVLIEDEDINAIKKCESLGETRDVGNIFKKILRGEKNATLEFYDKTIHHVESNVIKNSGEKDDAPEVWSVAQSEFRRKLDRKPTDPGYYQWRPTDSDFSIKATIFTYFLKICRSRWLDMLRKKAIDKKHHIVLYEELKSDYEDQSYAEEDERDELRSRILKAIDQLGEPCRKVLRARWFGGDFGEVVSSKELGGKLGYAPGTIDNIYSRCLKKIQLIVNPKTL